MTPTNFTFTLLSIVFIISTCQFSLIQCTSLYQPFTLSLNFKNIHTATPDLGSDVVFLTSDSNPARIGTINLRNFEQIDQVLLIRNVWVQGCDFCYARKQLFCLAKNEDNDELKMLRIMQSQYKNTTTNMDTRRRRRETMFSDILKQPLNTEASQISDVEKNDTTPPSPESNTHRQENSHHHSVLFGEENSHDATDDFRDGGENEYDEIQLAKFDSSVYCAMTQDNDLMYVAYSDAHHANTQGIYVVDKDSFKVIMNSTFVHMQGNPERDIELCTSDLQIFLYEDMIYTLCVQPNDAQGGESTVIYVVGRKDLYFHYSQTIPLRVTGQMIRQGEHHFLAPSTVFFFSEQSSQLLPYTLIPFEAKQPVRVDHLDKGITCAVVDTVQEFAYLFTTGPLVSILKFSLKSHEVVDSYNLHNAGDVSTCFLGRSGRYLYFAQNLLDTSSVIEFSLDSFVPNEILELERLPVSYIINGALSKVAISASHQKVYSPVADRIIDYRMYLVTETSPAKIIEVSILPSGDLVQTNFLNLPDDRDSGLKAQPIFNDARTHAYFARASSPSVLYKVDLKDMQITKSLALPTHLSTISSAMKWNHDENVGIYATATSPSYVFRVCLRSLTVIAEAKIYEHRLSLFSIQSDDGLYGYFATDVIPATVLKVNLITLELLEEYPLNSYPTCCICSSEHLWFGLASGKVVRIGKHNLSDISYSVEKMSGTPLSCVRDSSGRYGFFALEEFSSGTTLVKMNLASDNMKQESSIHLDMKGVFRTAFLDESEHLAYFINYGSRTTIVPVDLTDPPINFWIILLVILSSVFIIGLLLSLGLYINLKKRWWLRNRAERAIKKKLLEHDSMSSGRRSKNSYGTCDSMNRSWYIPPEDIKLDSRISEGAFGVVYKGRWQGAVVAIKKIKIQGLFRSGEDQEHYDSLFMREVSVLRKLHFPHIVQYLGVSLLENEQRFIVTEFIPNGDLSRYIRCTLDEPPLLSLKQRLIILEDISKGMQYLHSLSPPLIHRDLKPSNILLDSSFRAKICDFGLSSHNRQMTMTGNLGTIQYMSNQVIAETRYDQSADVYSFGILCYEVVFSREAFAGETNCFKLGMEIMKGRRPPIHTDMTHGSPILEQLSLLMQQCWDPDASVRPSFKNILKTLSYVRGILHSEKVAQGFQVQ
eukprot:CAMPEP_0117442798 /NCGR_PEP_ID=MMETSP0759-20121206/4347_1 /TAXON_ID=63605 /ORGANISM="Percolomonas cosmopolitus, Strain WS" /LENGTH=1159 /DNA_ID=CAMNT_0005234717 /DNA_START=529 /DNA_END=4008 /DNA_ORIENTATION=+